MQPRETPPPAFLFLSVHTVKELRRQRASIRYSQALIHIGANERLSTPDQPLFSAVLAEIVLVFGSPGLSISCAGSWLPAGSCLRRCAIYGYRLARVKHFFQFFSKNIAKDTSLATASSETPSGHLSIGDQTATLLAGPRRQTHMGRLWHHSSPSRSFFGASLGGRQDPLSRKPSAGLSLVPEVGSRPALASGGALHMVSASPVSSTFFNFFQTAN